MLFNRELLSSLRIPRELILLAIHASNGNAGGMHKLVSSTAFLRVSPRMVTETILEVHLFAGFPAAIEAFIALRPYFKTRTAQSNPAAPARTSFRARGVRVCRRVYSENFGKLMKNMRALNPDLARWIIEDGYGKVLGRPGLSLLDRELIAIGVLGSSGWSRQLESHIKGAMNTGGTPQMLLKTLGILRPFVKVGRRGYVDTLFSRVLKTGKIPKRS